MTELEKIEYAKSFIDKLANGINPLDDSPIPENDIANNVRLSRCFFYVSDILRQVIDNGGVEPIRVIKHSKKAFALSDAEREKIQISEVPVTVSEIATRLNALVDLETTKRISAASINKWLLSLQMLEVVLQPDGRTSKCPTEQGRAIGIFTEERRGQYGTYIALLFFSSAQQFIYDNVEAISDFKSEKKDRLSEFHGRPWTEIHDERLIEMFNKGVPVAEIAFTLKRTEGGVQARLKRLGLIENRSDAK